MSHLSGANTWFGDMATARQITDELFKAGLCTKAKICGLPSWYRLLSELIGMLAYAPMKAISMDDFANRLRGGIGRGSSTHCNHHDILVEHVLLRCQQGKKPKSHIVADLLRTFQARLCNAIDRDVQDSMRAVRQDARRIGSEIQEFLSIIPMLGEQAREITIDELLEQATKTIKRIMKTRLQDVIDDLCEANEASNDAVPKWIRPVKTHHMNGQCRTDTLTLATKSPCPNWKLFVSTVTVLSAAWFRRFVSLHPLPSLLSFLFAVRRFVSLHPLPSLLSFLFAVSRFVSLRTVKRLLACFIVFVQRRNQGSEIAFHDPTRSRGGTTVNARSCVNREIFESSTHCSDLGATWNQNDHEVADVEVFRLLFPVHRELAEAFAAEYKGMIQRLKSVEDVPNCADPSLQKAVRLLMPHFLEPDTSDAGDMWTVSEELHKSKSLWPMHSSIDEFICESKRMSQQQNNAERFVGQVDEKLSGEASWLRLCHEFIYVLTHLRMPLVTSDELQNCRCSAGTSILASPEEVVNKLAKHRLVGNVCSDEAAPREVTDVAKDASEEELQKTTGMHACQVFTQRMHELLERDMRIAMKSEGKARMQSDKGVKKVDSRHVRLAHDRLLCHFDGIVGQVVSRLNKRLDDLQPFDRTMQNGRIDLISRKMRCASRSDQAPDRQQMPCLTYGSCNGTCFIQSSNAGECYNALTKESSLTLEEVNKPSGSTSPWNDANLAGDGIHDMALKVHKVVLADAICHCRPRLSKLITAMVDEETLRIGLHCDQELNYLRFYGGMIDEKRRACALMRDHAEDLQVDLEEVDDFRDCHVLKCGQETSTADTPSSCTSTAVLSQVCR
eukprot:TRINITY_DN27811_c0_g1_i1.p1 TRINITY_DN27811_c0_g1~~TRINITY_DN27811_c0_g1_i1.p1  ORF type:complete len:842 (-),score=167.22 TRINITY_DN27811_c0_g1_i1:129-2654(-)